VESNLKVTGSLEGKENFRDAAIERPLSFLRFLFFPHSSEAQNSRHSGIQNHYWKIGTVSPSAFESCFAHVAPVYCIYSSI
jgi:hypothetical protein